MFLFSVFFINSIFVQSYNPSRASESVFTTVKLILLYNISLKFVGKYSCSHRTNFEIWAALIHQFDIFVPTRTYMWMLWKKVWKSALQCQLCTWWFYFLFWHIHTTYFLLIPEQWYLIFLDYDIYFFSFFFNFVCLWFAVIEFVAKQAFSVVCQTQIYAM